jgi:hypothetical protein
MAVEAILSKLAEVTQQAAIELKEVTKESVESRIMNLDPTDQLNVIRNHSLEGLVSENKEGIRKLQESSERLQETAKQYEDEMRKATVKGEIQTVNIGEWRKISDAEYQSKKLEFEANRKKIIAEWKKVHGDWPRYTEDVFNSNGTRIRQAGDRYDAHHQQPLRLGGENTAQNITPMHANDHYDKQGIHRPGGPCDSLAKPFS